MWKRWDEVSLRAHARFVMGMLAAGLCLSIAGSFRSLETAWIISFMATAAALGAQIRLGMRVSGNDGLNASNAP